MFVLYSSNRTERLAEQLATVIGETGGQTLFSKAVFLVQSREMERMLSQFLADRFGVWGNSRYLLPMQFIEDLSAAVGVAHESHEFDRSILAWRLEQLLRQIDEPSLQPVRSYLSGAHAGVKRFQFARQLANLFDQYQIMRPELIRAWDSGRRVTLNNSEIWQSYLWQQLRQESSTRHRGEVVAALIEKLGERDLDLPAELRRVFVFGLHTLPPQFLSVLTALADDAAVHFFLLAPCSFYWGDMESRRSRLARDAAGDAAADAADFHPLLVGLGRQGADFQELLLNQVEELVDGPDLFVSHGEDSALPLLFRLQNDLLQGFLNGSTGISSNAQEDDSVVIVSCHSRMREVAVLKDHLLKWLTEAPSLGLHDIVVMAPDIQLYADIIPAVFNDVAHDISDCRKRRDNRYVEIFSQFLGLFKGRFTAPEILSLLDQPEVGRSFAIGPADLETIAHWLKEAGIRWGLSSEQRHQDGLVRFEAGTWRQGLERMLLGLAAGSKDPIDDLIPYIALEGGSAELLGSFCEFIEMIELSRGRINKAHSLREWSALLHDMASRLFGTSESSDYLALQEMLADLADPASSYHEQLLDFEVIHQWFEFEAETITSVDFLRGRLTFCSMLPMRSIPFKVICLLGLNDGEFPKQDRFLPFNLLTEHYERGDRSRRADDRYQFLEAILAARQRLYISYLGQSIRTNAPLPPSPVVAELIEAIEQGGGALTVINHPLQPFDAAYFSGEKALFSHHRHYCATAQSLRTRAAEINGPWFREQIDPARDDHVNLPDLASFLTNPQRYFVRQILRMTLRQEVELLEDSEPFSLDALERYLASQELLEALLAGNEAELILKEFQQKQIWPLGYPGRQQFEELCGELEKFGARLERVDLGAPLPHLEFETVLGSAPVSGVLANLRTKGQLLYRYGRLKGRDLLLGWLLHLAAGAAGSREGPTKVVLKDATITIADGCGSLDDLSQVVELYHAGCRQPSSLYTEAAFSYCQQNLVNRCRGRTSPLAKAIKTLDRQIVNGFAEELSILFTDPRGSVLLDDEFVALCNDFLLPVMEQVEIDTKV